MPDSTVRVSKLQGVIVEYVEVLWELQVRQIIHKWEASIDSLKGMCHTFTLCFANIVQFSQFPCNRQLTPNPTAKPKTGNTNDGNMRQYLPHW